MEELPTKHRKEQQDLQARITQKKKSATKKTRKGINEECDRLQRELLERQHLEIAELNYDPQSPVHGIDDLSIEDKSTQKRENDVNEDKKGEFPRTGEDESGGQPFPDPVVPIPRPKKVNRHKARLARRAQEQEAQSAQAAEEAASQIDNRGNERKIMDGVFSRLGLKEREIRPDGHCLYSAIASLLVDIGVELNLSTEKGLLPEPPHPIKDALRAQDDGYRAVRAATANFLLTHPNDFAPFIDEPLLQYAKKIELTAEWGGQLELQAIARAYIVDIHVVQGDGRIEKFEAGNGNTEREGNKKIWLAYYRHSYGLGEHYNALTQAP
jgi:OTU domain-containing protein 6